MFYLKWNKLTVMSSIKACFLLLFFFFNISYSIAQENIWLDKIDQSVWLKAEAGESIDFLVVLHEQADLSKATSFKIKEERGQYVFNQLKNLVEHTQKDLQHFLNEEGVNYQSFYIINSIYTKGNKRLIKAIAKRQDVAQIQSNPQARLEEPEWQNYEANLRGEVEWGIAMIGADKVWELGYSGQGVVVGGGDTGYDWEHEALREKYRGWNGSTGNHNYNWHDAIHEISLLHEDSIVAPGNNPCGLNVLEPCDDNNHGTHTMGTMIGGIGDNLIGVAPNAKWVACRNMERGYGSPVTYIEYFEWMLAPTDLNNENPDPSKSPHVINNSWSCPELEGCNEGNWSTMETVVNNLKSSGVVVVVSAGNSGKDGCGTVSTPAAMFENSFTVGATTPADTIAKFSSRGPVTVDGSDRTKPNVAAPGVAVRSSFKNNTYGLGSGTSMAGPHTVGAVALMISANPKLAGQVETIENILEETAVQKTTEQICGNLPGTSIPNHTYGYGRIDALAAVNKALSLNILSENEAELEVLTSPNPFTSELKLELKNKKGEARFELFDSLGKLLGEASWTLELYTVRTLQLDYLASGVYYYFVTVGDDRVGGKVVKH